MLVADPDIETLIRYRTVFQLAGSGVVEAIDGRDALVKALTHAPSLVLTELRLPFLDGYDLCRVLRDDYQTRSLPIFVATSESQHSVLDRAYRAGADLVLTKPVNADTLLQRSQALVERAAHAQARSTALRSQTMDRLAKSENNGESGSGTTRRPQQEPSAVHDHDSAHPPTTPALPIVRSGFAVRLQPHRWGQ